MASTARDGRKIVARNKKALHDYHIVDTWEAGLVLAGPEVKSLRDGRANLTGSFARIDRGEVWLHDMHISPYGPAAQWNLDPKRPRKLLLKAREIRRLVGAVTEKGLTLVPLELYFRGGYAKVTLALGRGKKLHDKRESMKLRDAEREMERAAGRRR